MNPFEAQLERIRAKLSAVRERELQTFGAGSHGYALGPPLSEAEIAAFEGERGVTLPESYRAFLRHVGHGGPGRYGGAAPYYGLYALSEWADFPGWIADEVPADWLVRESPLREGPNPLPDWDEDDGPGDDVVEAYRGILSLGTCGCTYATGLVVSGPMRGRVVYLDADHGEAPYVGRDVDFLAWYERWLDELLAGFDGSWFGYGPAGGEAELLALVESDDPVLVAEAVGNLDKLPSLSEAVWPVLRRAAAHESAEVRARTAWVLRRGDRESLDAIRALLADPEDRVRRAALTAADKAGLLDDAVRDALLELTQRGDDFQRLDAVAALAMIGDDRLVPIAEQMLTIDRVPEAPGRSHALTIAQIVARDLKKSPSATLRALRPRGECPERD